jgi:hypothetical protein
VRRVTLTALALGVAACGGAGPPTVANQAANADELVIAETETRPAEGGGAVAPPAAPKAAAIPAKFRGIWAEGRAACAQLSHPSRLIISERVIRYPSLVLVSESVEQPTYADFVVKGYSQRTGAPAEAHLSIDATGNILTDEAGGGAVRMSCG